MCEAPEMRLRHCEDPQAAGKGLRHVSAWRRALSAELRQGRQLLEALKACYLEAPFQRLAHMASLLLSRLSGQPGARAHLSATHKAVPFKCCAPRELVAGQLGRCGGSDTEADAGQAVFLHENKL